MAYAKNWLKPDEVKRMLDLQDLQEKHEIWLSLLYYPALRVSEAINVQVKDLNFNDVCIDVWGGKGRQSNTLQKAPCDIEVLKKIKRFCEHSDLRPSDFIMYSRVSPQTTRQNVYLTVQNICVKVGINKKIGTHTMRRSRAEHLLDGGLKLEYVSRILRHRNINTTMAYLDISVSDLNTALSKINDPMKVI